jgi:hypothetical protein
VCTRYIPVVTIREAAYEVFLQNSKARWKTVARKVYGENPTDKQIARVRKVCAGMRPSYPKTAYYKPLREGDLHRWD